MNPVRLSSSTFILFSLFILSLVFFQNSFGQSLNVSAGPDKEIIASQSIQIGGSPTASGGIAPYFYAWFPGEGLNDATISNPVSSAITTTEYIITVTDATGAVATDTVTVFVKRYLYAVNDNGPAQLTRVDVDSPTPSLEIVADYIIYAGPAGYGLPIGAILDETEAAALDITTGTAYIISNLGVESALLTLDLETGFATGIGFLGTDDVNGLAFDPLNKQLYGVSSRQARLYNIDILTGAATPLPSYITFSNSNIEGLSFDYTQYPPALYGIDEYSGNLYQIDIFSGAGIVIGQTIPSFESIEFGADGTLYAASNLSRIYLINRSTFEATEFANSLRIDGEGLIIYDGRQIPDNPIPVELTSFTVRQENDVVLLRWTTASETENLGFHVFRRSDKDYEYSKISTKLIAGAINSYATTEYTWIDSTVEDGNNYHYKIADVNLNGNVTFHQEVTYKVDIQPSAFSLQQNYPNPFSIDNPSHLAPSNATTIEFSLPEATDVKLQIFNIRGQLVKTLVHEKLESGIHPILWDGTSTFGSPVSSGMYIYRISTNTVHEHKVMTLIR